MSRKWERDGHKVLAGPTFESRLMHEIRKYPQGVTILARSRCNCPYRSYRISRIFLVKDEISPFLYFCRKWRDRVFLVLTKR
jgi:hypothetical protein